MSGTDDSGDGLSRRRWLQVSAAGTAGALAGCTNSDSGGETTTETTISGSGDGTTTSTTEQTVEVLDQTFRRGMGDANILEPEMAPYASGYDYEYSTTLQGKGGRFNLGTSQFLWFDWDGEPELDEGAGELRFSIRPGLKWHSGEQGVIEAFSAKDLVYQEQLYRRMTPKSERADDPPVTGFRADGDDTFVLELNTDAGYNDAQLVNDYTQDYRFHVYRKGIYEGKLQALRDASSKDKKDQIRTEVTQTTANVNTKPLSGPWMIQDAAQQRVKFEAQPDHWVHQQKDINWNGFEFKAVSGSGNVTYAACRQDQVDLCSIPGTVSNPPSQLKQVINSNGAGFGQGFIVPYASPADPVFWKDPKVAAKTRQAIAYATDAKRAGKNQLSIPDSANRPPKAKFLDKVHGFQSTAMAQDVLGDDYQNFPAYEQDQQKAASRLKSAGFTKDGGTWYKPDGDKFSLEINSIGWTQKGVQTMVGNLNNFGIDANQVQINGTQFVSKYWGEQDYKALIAESTPHSGPPSSFMSYWWDPSVSTVLPPGSDDRSAEWTKYPVPPVGQMDAEPTEEVDVRSVVSEFATSKESAIREGVKKLSWVTAYHLPVYPMWLNPDEIGINTTHFEHPTPKPDFSQYGGNFGIATSQHNLVHTTAKNHHYYRGIGTGSQFAVEGEGRAMWAKDDQ